MVSATGCLRADRAAPASVQVPTPERADGVSAPAAELPQRFAERRPPASGTGTPEEKPAELVVSSAARPVPDGGRVRAKIERSEPVVLDVPAIELRTTVAPIGLTEAGTVAAPQDWYAAGWFAGGVEPGQVGPAVFTGHVDSTSGPAVFFGLERLAAGDEVFVGRADGSILRFVVTASEQYGKSDFPSEKVYGPDPEPELRLITCDGAFDPTTGHYEDNRVVYATLEMS